MQCCSEPIGVRVAVREQSFDIGWAAQQSPRARMVAHLSGDDVQVDRLLQAFTDRVQFGDHAALGATSQATTPPF